jgi:hypothetical protein
VAQQADLFPEPSRIPDDQLRDCFDLYRKHMNEVLLLVADLESALVFAHAHSTTETYRRVMSICVRLKSTLRIAERGVRPAGRPIADFGWKRGL